MSLRSAHDLVKLMLEDVEFRNQVAGAPTREDKHSLLEARGFGDVSPEEIEQASRQITTSELTEDELEAVAGGRGASWVEAISTVVGAIATAAVAAL